MQEIVGNSTYLATGLALQTIRVNDVVWGQCYIKLVPLEFTKNESYITSIGRYYTVHYNRSLRQTYMYKPLLESALAFPQLGYERPWVVYVHATTFNGRSLRYKTHLDVVLQQPGLPWYSRGILLLYCQTHWIYLQRHLYSSKYFVRRRHVCEEMKFTIIFTYRSDNCQSPL